MATSELAELQNVARKASQSQFEALAKQSISVRWTMPKEIFPSSYECDCGHQSHFSENTIREAKQMSHKRKIRLSDSDPDEHTIVFHRGEMIEILCPHRRPKMHATGEGCGGKA